MVASLDKGGTYGIKDSGTDHLSLRRGHDDSERVVFSPISSNVLLNASQESPGRG